MNLNWFNLRILTSPRFLIALFTIVMCTQFTAIEGFGVSPVKVVMMALAPLIFIVKTPQINKALIWGGAFWLCCFFCAYFAGPIRWSTLGYFGMFIMTFICYYSLLRTGEVTIEWFADLLKALIIIYGVVLILQQLSVLIGIRTNPLININANMQPYISLTKLPILTQEPSSSARMLAVFMLSYLECLKIINGNIKPTFQQLFNTQNRLMSCLFLWSMLTMGSGTAFIALGILSLYFITFRSSIYVIPLIVGLIILGNLLQLKQFERAKASIEVTSSLDAKEIMEEDASAAVRIIPLINLIKKTDLTDKAIWFGQGTTENPSIYRDRTQDYNGMIGTYGFLSFIMMLLFIYICVIKNFFSLQTIMFIFLLGLTLSNFAYIWGALMVFAGVRYFQDLQYETVSYELISEDE